MGDRTMAVLRHFSRCAHQPQSSPTPTSPLRHNPPMPKPPKKSPTSATVGYEAQLWQMADALRGSMDAMAGIERDTPALKGEVALCNEPETKTA